MKIVAFSVAICASIFLENVSGISISPYRPDTDPAPMCTLDLKICAEEQYLGTGPDGCPKCLQCPLRKMRCRNGIPPAKKPKVDNQCPTYYCPNGPVRCTKEMKYCAGNQYVATGATGCQECLPCPVAFHTCPFGSSHKRNPAVVNQCPTYTCT